MESSLTLYFPPPLFPSALGAINVTAGIKSMVVTSSLLTVGAAGWSWFKMQLL